MSAATTSRILVVDGDPACRRTLFRCLQGAGFECVTSATAAEGLGMARKVLPDLIIMDLRLPDMTGFDAMKFLQEDPRTMRISVLAATRDLHAVDLLRSAAICLRAVGLVEKPFEGSALLLKVREAIARKASGKESVDPWKVQRGSISIDLRHRKVEVNGKPLRLGPKRYEALLALARSRDGLTGRMLGSLVWNAEGESHNIVAKTIWRLRHDIERVCGLDLITSIDGGYKLHQ